jgi:Uma2 family endonuclease
MFAMSGATEPHNLVSINVAGDLSQQLRKQPGFVFSSNMHVRVGETGLYTYPDVIAVRGERQFPGRQARCPAQPGFDCWGSFGIE